MMERSDIAALSDEMLEEFVVHPPENPSAYAIRMTSGTTNSQPILALWQKKDAAEWHAGSMRHLVIALGPLSMRLSNVLFFRNNSENSGALILPLDPGALDASAERLLNDFAPDSFYAFPSFVARLSGYMSSQARRSVRILGLCGEAASKTLRDLFTLQFPHARQVVTYGSTETGILTRFPCEHLSPGRYHPRDGVAIEIREPDEYGVGRLLISKDLLFGRRMEQYNIGDMARIVPEPCPCGEKLTFEVFGRAGYDFLKIAGALLRREEFDRVASECAALFDDYRAEAEEVLIDGALKGRIVLTVYRRDGAVSAEEVSQRFSAQVYLTPSQTLSGLVAKELFLPLEVVVRAAPLSQAGKVMKLSLRT